MSQQQPLFNPATTTSTPSQPNSCQLCQQRKVKCNRQQPCVGCAKANVECVYRVPPPPKRRKRKSPEEVLRARLRRYEEILRDLGVRLNDGDDADVARLQHDVIAGSRSRESPAVPPGTSSGCERTGESDSADGLASKMGRLIVADGKSRFLEKYSFAIVKGQEVNCNANHTRQHAMGQRRR